MLRELGLHDALNATFAGEVAPPPYVPDRDRALRVRNAAGIARYSRELADALRPLLAGDRFPLVLGGDCSIALGVGHALSQAGRFGLIYIDAHSDCQTPAISETGGVAGMPLAMLTGHTINLLDPSFTPRAFFADHDVVLAGCRDLFDIEVANGMQRVRNTDIRVRDLGEIRRAGAADIAAAMLDDLSARGVERSWIHLDVDVLNPEIMPAVDSPDPGGLYESELLDLLRPLLASGRVAGMHVTIYDPDRDPDGSAGRLLVRLLTEAFA